MKAPESYWYERLPRVEGRAVAGAPLGILVIESHWALIPGNIANASTFEFPVIYETVPGVDFQALLLSSDKAQDRVLQAARRLVDKGVKAIIGSCGSFALYQKTVAGAVPVPVFLSPMLQIPWILPGISPKRLGVIVATKEAIVENVFDQCGIGENMRGHIEFYEALELSEFRQMSTSAEGFVPAKLEAELIEWLGCLDLSRFGALLLQCSDLPPFANAISRVTTLPVFDGVTLAQWVVQSVIRKSYY